MFSSRHQIGAVLALAWVLLALSDSPASGQTYVAYPTSGTPPPQYVHFSGQAQASLWWPEPAQHPNPTTAILMVHRTGNFMNHVGLRELSRRGFVSLGLNTHAVNNEGAVEYDGRIAMDLRAAVEFLRNDLGMERVVMIGHSGGGNTISLYQAIAENGLSICQGENKIVECGDDPRQIGPVADALIFMDSNVGTAINMLRRWNPAVIDERDPRQLDPTLNPWLESNGYNPNGCSRYSEEFKERYFRAQAERIGRLTVHAQEIAAAMDNGTHVPTDNDKFVAYRINARLYDLDNTIDSHTRSPRKLLRDNREIVTQVVHTVRPCGEPLGYSTPEVDAQLERTRDMNVRALLGIWSIRANDSMYDIDYCSANGSTMCMVQHVRAPTLITASQGNPYVVDNERMFEMSGSVRKDYVVIEGATHGMDNCTACEGGPYHNVRRNFWDYLATWIDSGFTPVDRLR